MRINFIYLFLVVLILTSCHKDVNDDNLNSVTETQITVPYTFNEIEGTIIGFVYDEDELPIPDASVSIYSASTITNEYGVFQFSNVKMDGQGTLIKITKDGYLSGADFIYPNDEGAGTARLKLLKLNFNGDFNSETGGSIGFENDGLVTFTKNSIAEQNGSSYLGGVESYIKSNYHDEPSSNDELLGSLIGLDKQGSNKVLGMIGTVQVSLHDEAGSALKIKSEQGFNIKFPISQDQLASANDEVVVWKYNENSGYWDEIALAKKEGQFYVVEVSEVGHYIFAESYLLTHYCAKLVDGADFPSKNFKFNVFIDNKLCGIGASDNDGFICSKLPQGEELELQIIHPMCDEIVKSLMIDPLEEPNNGGDIVIDIDQDIRSGNVFCNDIPVSNALVVLKNGTNITVQVTDGSGLFIINLGELTCVAEQSVDIFAINDNEISPTLQINDATNIDINLEICEPACDHEVFFSFEKLDPCVNGQYDRVNLIIDGGSGSFTYLWNNGGTENSNTSLNTGSEICVQVTDLSTGCVVNHCELIEEFRSLELINISSKNTSCTQNGGLIESEITGGTEPFKYKWESNNGFNSTISNPANLWPGIYQLTITDGYECEITSEIEVYDVNIPINSDVVHDCEFSTIVIFENEGYGPYEYLWQWNGGQSTETSLIVYAPGEYNVIVTDQNLCVRSSSFTLGSVGTFVELNSNYNCNTSYIEYDAINFDYQYFYESVESFERFDLEINGGKLNIPILESGYTYYYGTLELNSGCENKELINLPHFEGLQIQNIQNTSCESCNDGFISVVVDDNQDCTGGCVAGETIIIDKSTATDVTSLNTLAQLAAGTYIVIVIDENNGCYIAHEEVIIE